MVAAKTEGPFLWLRLGRIFHQEGKDWLTVSPVWYLGCKRKLITGLQWRNSADCGDSFFGMVFRLHTQTDYRFPVTEFRCQHVLAAELTRSVPHRNIICVESKSVAAYTKLSPTLHDSSAHDLFTFKEDPTRRRKSILKRRQCANNFSCRLRNYVVLSIFMRQKTFFFLSLFSSSFFVLFLLRIWAPWAPAMFVRSLSMKSRKMFAHDVRYTSGYIRQLYSWRHRHSRAVCQT